MITYFFSILSYFTNIINIKDVKRKEKDNVELKNLYQSNETVQEKFHEIRLNMELEDRKYCKLKIIIIIIIIIIIKIKIKVFFFLILKYYFTCLN